MASRQTDIENKIDGAVLNYGPSMYVPWYLSLCYAYYHRDVSLVSDEYFDKLCKELLNAFDALEVNHRHMGLIDVNALSAGTGYHIRDDKYPSVAISAADRLIAGA